MFDIQEIVGGDPTPGVRVVLLGQSVLKLGLLSPHLLRPGALALAQQSSHDCLHLCQSCLGGDRGEADMTGPHWTKWVCCGGVVHNDPRTATLPTLDWTEVNVSLLSHDRRQ